MLGSLLRAGAPFQRSPGQLAKRFDLTSGAMTNRLDRLEAEELIRRLPDPDDRRGVIVELTPKGRESGSARSARRPRRSRSSPLRWTRASRSS